MASRIFLDTNIVLDFLLQRDIGYDDAKRIVEHVISGNVSAFITPSIVHIAGYFLKRVHGAETTKKMLLSFLEDIKTIDISYPVVQQALKSNMLDVEDSLQYYSALHHHVDVFISRDMPLKKYSLQQMPVITPKEFLESWLR